MAGKRMRVFYDFEFLEDGKTIEPISLGMVREDGDELYLVFNDFNTRRVAKHQWLMDNVMSSIDHEEFIVCDYQGAQVLKDIHVTDLAAVNKVEAAEKILEFVDDIWPEFWNWYGAYDHVCLGQLYGPMVEWPKKFPMFSCDIKQLHMMAGKPEMPKQPDGVHNALEDAKFNIVRYNYLKGLL